VPRARYRASSVVVGKRLCLFGGHDGSRHLNDVHLYRSTDLVWIASLVETRFRLAGRLFLILSNLAGVMPACARRGTQPCCSKIRSAIPCARHDLTSISTGDKALHRFLVTVMSQLCMEITRCSSLEAAPEAQ
jgi:hypothetical protein